MVAHPHADPGMARRADQEANARASRAARLQLARAARAATESREQDARRPRATGFVRRGRTRARPGRVARALQRFARRPSWRPLEADRERAGGRAALLSRSRGSRRSARPRGGESPSASVNAAGRRAGERRVERRHGVLAPPSMATVEREPAGDARELAPRAARPALWGMVPRRSRRGRVRVGRPSRLAVRARAGGRQRGRRCFFRPSTKTLFTINVAVASSLLVRSREASPRRASRRRRPRCAGACRAAAATVGARGRAPTSRRAALRIPAVTSGRFRRWPRIIDDRRFNDDGTRRVAGDAPAQQTRQGASAWRGGSSGDAAATGVFVTRKFALSSSRASGGDDP